MVIFVAAIILGLALLVWLWKVPLKNLINSLKESGSSVFEAYAIATFLFVGTAFAIYMMAQVI